MLGPDLDFVLAFNTEAAHVLAVPADADGKPGGASVRVSARPLPSRDRIDGRVFLLPGGRAASSATSTQPTTSSGQ